MQAVFDFCRDSPVRPKRPERLFFCLFPDTEAALCAGRLARRFAQENHLEGMRLETERLHVSLHHVGDYKHLRGKFAYAARKAGDAVSMHPFEVTFRFIKSFEGAPPIGGRVRRRPLVLLGDGDALFELHKVLGAAMEKNGLRAGKHFTPHMTLFYGSKPVPMQAIEPIHALVHAFALVHSELGLGRYNTVGRWLLEG